ncbi:N-acetylneuraminate synthase family protein [Phaeodactylibacter xiamenensis]|uniref:N-acetylneuraminate synthase family protein n=1 Tax=Phaeodactylibacter xiamenensis TaxID=1524460 RepID=UPI003CCBF19C
MSKKGIQLGSKWVGENDLYFVADIGANHNGSLDKAIKLIHLAKEAGADAAKFQNFQASRIVSQVGFEKLKGQLAHQSNWKKSVFEVYEDASINRDWTGTLKKECDKAGIDYFTSPYDFESVDLVDPFVDLYKIGSGDITWLEIIDYILEKKKPVLIATGASSEEDVRRVMDMAQSKTDQLVLMQCNTNYTGKDENFDHINLNVLKKFSEQYPNVMLGLSDHTAGHATTLGAIALGARVIEKHFTDDNDQEGPDHSFAMNPNTWRDMVDRSYELIRSLGDGQKVVEANEISSQIVQRRCIRAFDDIQEGQVIKRSDLIVLRPIPEDGIEPYKIDEVIGKMAITTIKSGYHLQWGQLK